MAKITRFSEFTNEAIVPIPAKNVIEIDINDPKIMDKLEFVHSNNYKYGDIMINLSHALQSRMENEDLRFNAIFGYGDYDKEGKPEEFDWVVYGRTPQVVVDELRKMIPEYVKANPRHAAVTESEDQEDEWRQMTKDEKIEKLNKKLEDAIKKKNIKEADADEIRKRMDKEISRSGPDKIRHEMMKRAKEEDSIKKGSDDEEGDEASRLDKAKELVKQEVWKGYKQPVAQFFDTMFDLMAG